MSIEIAFVLFVIVIFSLMWIAIWVEERRFWREWKAGDDAMAERHNKEWEAFESIRTGRFQ